MDPVTAITVAQSCISLVQMMSGNGAGVGDLLALQAQMLRNISMQIAQMQKSIDLIFSDVEEIKALLGALPAQEVIETFKAEVTGALSRYIEVMRTYDRDRADKGIDYANAQNTQEFTQVVEQIRKARDILMGYRHEMTIPVVGCALQTEIHCMVLNNVRDNRIRAALQSYNDWFDAWLDPGSPIALATKTAKEEANGKALLAARSGDADRFADLMCFNAHVRIADPRGDMYIDYVEGSKQSLQWVVEDDAALGQIHDPARTINAGGGAIPGVFFDLRQETASVVTEVVPPADGPAANTIYHNLLAETRKVGGRWPGYTGICSTSGNYLQVSADAKNAQNGPLVISRLRLLSLGGFRTSTLNCSTFCHNMLASLA